MTPLQKALYDVFKALNELDKLLLPLSKVIRDSGVKPLEEQSSSDKIKFTKLMLSMQGLEIPQLPYEERATTLRKDRKSR